MALYALLLGWPFAIGFVALVAHHEMGHVVAVRRRHMKTSSPVFLPFPGAFIGLRQRPRDAKEEAFLGTAGPVFGLAATSVSALLWAVTGDRFWAALASAGFLIHVFTLMPVLPLDGRRTVGFWRWLAWIPGGVGALAILVYRPTPPHWQFSPVSVLLIALVIWCLSAEPRIRPGGLHQYRPTGPVGLYGAVGGAPGRERNRLCEFGRLRRMNQANDKFQVADRRGRLSNIGSDLPESLGAPARSWFSSVSKWLSSSSSRHPPGTGQRTRLGVTHPVSTAANGR